MVHEPTQAELDKLLEMIPAAVDPNDAIAAYSAYITALADLAEARDETTNLKSFEANVVAARGELIFELFKRDDRTFNPEVML